MKDRIAFMQGRLSPLVDGKIQAFPWATWTEEFRIANAIGLTMMEWTLDQDRLHENPLLTRRGRFDIRQLSAQFGVTIPSVTGDCFMQTPFWKASGKAMLSLQDDFRAIADSCAAMGVSIIVIPLVDGGRLENSRQEDLLVRFLGAQASWLASNNIRVAFESDFDATSLARLIENFDPKVFGINYDIGNSASMGHNPDEELGAYRHRVLNVHVKDRELGGSTVPLGRGSARFDLVFAQLAAGSYSGNYVLQTARATDGNHSDVLLHYRDMTANWLERYAA
jgi:L-ribulose-5-phosphate 3-epimerase